MKNTRFLYSTSALSRLVAASLVTFAVGLDAQSAQALPQGGSVVGGNANATLNYNGNMLTINQSASSAIINWNTFNIGQHQTTNIVDAQGNSSVTLNRVTGGGGPSQILGLLTSNGIIMLVNPNGVFFGPHSQVNAEGLLATTADIANADFKAGNYKFNIAGNASASIINKGKITAKQGGLVALVAPGVENDGVIRVNVGTAALEATKTFTVDFYGDGLYSFTLDKGTTQYASDQKGGTLSAALVNTGTISAKGGTVNMTVNAAGNIVDNAINTTGIVEATTSHKGKNGNIVLDGGNGFVIVDGNVNTVNKTAAKAGGSVTIKGGNVVLTDGKITTAGTVSVKATQNIIGTNSTVKSTTDGDVDFNAPNISLTGETLSDITLHGNNNTIDITDSTVTGNGTGIGIADLDPSSKVNISGVKILDVTTGIYGKGGKDWTLTGDKITAIAGGKYGIELLDVKGTNTIGETGKGDGNTILGFGTGIYADNVSRLSVVHNDISAPGTAIDVNNSDGVLISDNRISDSKNGIALTDSFGSEISDNRLTDITDNGIYAKDVDFLYLVDNIITGNGKGATGAGKDAIKVDDAFGVEIAGNRITGINGGTGAGKDGIALSNSDFVYIEDNIVRASGKGSVGAVGDGINLTNDGGVYTAYNIINANHGSTDAAGTGIAVVNSGGITLASNTINYATTGISVDPSSDITISGNTLSGILGDGFDVTSTDGITITDNTLNGVAGNGILMSSSDDATVTGNTLTAIAGGKYGIELTDVTGINTVGKTGKGNDGNTVLGFGTGIYADNVDNLSVTHNAISAPGTAIRIKDSTGALISDNRISDSKNGIIVTGSLGSDIADNRLTDITDNGIVAKNDADVFVVGNVISANGAGHMGAGKNGIVVKNSDGAEIVSNRIVGRNGATGAGRNGIVLSDSDSAFVLDNIIRASGAGSLGAGNDGIRVTKSKDITVDGNVITARKGATQSVGNVGIDVKNSHTVDISDNTINDVATGVSVDPSSNITITGNVLSGITGDGFDVTAKNATITGNTITASAGNTGNGIFMNDTGTNSFSGNTVSDFGIGFNVQDTAGVKFASDTLTDNGVGIQLTGSAGATLTGETLTGNGIGFFAQDDKSGNGSSATVSDTAISGGLFGVWLSGPHTSMQFGDNNSTFSGVPVYFVLANGAMDVQVLDASAQTFDGVRASNFTFHQWQQAEEKTVDAHNSAGVGTVFYKNFPFFNIPGGSAFLNEILQERGNILLQSLFSYAGRTITNGGNEVSYNFTIGTTNLSLLGAAPGGVAPAVTGQNLGTLSPAAGGDNAAALAALNSGGAPSCGNNYLSAGYAPDFNAGSCRE